MANADLRQRAMKQHRETAFFRNALMHWHRHINTRRLPWKGEREPYRIWLSEIILQQTRAEQGTPYYLKFTDAYPTVEALAAAPDDAVFKLWEGLGYYARCRNMLATARQVAGEKQGRFPNTYEGLLALKGIGPYTAAAIASFAFGLPHAVVDGNVYRVLARFFGITTPTDGAEGKKTFQALADAVLDRADPGGFNQAMMDHGATICTPAQPHCGECPVAEGCVARAEGLVSILPVRAKKVAVRSRFFHYIFLHHNGNVWIRQRTEKDVWQGLYEPVLIERNAALERAELQQDDALKALNADSALTYEGALSQRLTHQLIHTRFFSLRSANPPLAPPGGLWVPGTQLMEYAFPRTLNLFFEKKWVLLKSHNHTDKRTSIMRGVNRVTLIGNLGKEPEVQYLEGNIAVAKFPLATTESFKDKTGQMVSQTEWHTVVLWRGLAELAMKFLHKGSLVYIEGRLRTRNWEDKEKIRRFSTEVVGDNLVMLDKRKDSEGYMPPSSDGAAFSGSTPPAMSIDGAAKPSADGTAGVEDILPF